MRTTGWVICVLAAGGAVIAARTPALARLGAENAALRQAAEQNETRQARASTLEKVSAAELARLRASQVELMKARQEVAELRKSALSAPGAPPADPASALRAAQELEQKTDLLLARQEAKEVSREVGSAAGSLLSLLTFLAHKNGGTFPGSLQEAQAMVRDEAFFMGSEDAASILARVPKIWPRLAFDFYSDAKPRTMKGPREFYFREREPRLQPDGTWKRYYGFSNGEAKEAASPSENFEDWEQKEAQKFARR